MPTAGATLACEPPPAGWVQYTVRQGDSLYALSRRFGTTVEALQRANCLAGARIYAGQRLWTPPGTAPATPTGAPTTAPTTALPQIDPTQAVIIDPCSNPLAHISAPGYGAQVGGIFWLYGAANIPNFMRYEIDVRRDGSATWMHLGSDRTPVEAGELAQVDPARFGSGAFWIRLTVVDKTYNYPPRCTILVYFP
ncbi:MAG: LysM peptidoglycan-binding domain-containing protein [Anaerolineae bacterium]|nr:LysM peptidoglycan-binding domain-containing protein [Anaerolineae bacterium]